MVVKDEKESQNVSYSFKDGLKDLKSGLNVFFLQLIAVVAVSVVYLAIKYNFSDSLMLHICLCVIGYGLLMTGSILLFAGDNFFGRPLSRYHKSLVHGVTIGLGSVLSIVGISIEIYSRGSEWPHFSSTHAIIGLVSMILMIIACLGGFLASHVQKLRHFIPFIKPIYWKIFHNSMGLLAYVTGMCAICYGFETWWFDTIGTYEIKVALIAASSVVTIWTVINPLTILLGYVKTAFN